MVYAKEDQMRLSRLRADEAVSLALQNRWEEAVAANRAVLEILPDDVDAHNRLGKALMELGSYQEAREAYARALELDRSNTIASKNLELLATMTEKSAASAPAEGGGRKARPDLFISEVGKSGATVLTNTAPEVLTLTAVGDEVLLRSQDATLVVENAKNECLGEVEPKLGLRLIKLMEGGNRYTAAITSLSKGGVRILIKETYQHPGQAGKLSFPPTGGEGFRPYTKRSLVRHDVDEEAVLDEEEMEEWGEGRQAKEVESHIYSEPPLAEVEEESEEEG